MIAWTAQTLIASSILMAIVLLLRAPVTRAFGARAAYALWSLPALRMILPPLPGWHPLYIPVFFWGPVHKTLGLTDPETAARLAHEMIRPTGAALHLLPIAPMPDLPPQLVVSPQPASLLASFGWAEILLAVWLGGTLLWFGWQMLRYRAFLRRAMSAARPLTSECGIDVLLSDRVDGPVAAGIVKRRIFLPGDFMQRYSHRSAGWRLSTRRRTMIVSTSRPIWSASRCWRCTGGIRSRTVLIAPSVRIRSSPATPPC